MKNLTDGVTNVVPSDVLLVRQDSAPPQPDGTTCVNITVQVLGATGEHRPHQHILSHHENGYS